ncbi:hypothetical protein C7M84_006963 [Penaeus vannamei]|uniref:Uncharacterized protein n=1 Tax=Penaeus vannamei TaxID=6689 RepID=A0A3R7P3M1_PENVA|nr:hypothetical protein C7M84_006963 [Penaeus vannamei]
MEEFLQHGARSKAWADLKLVKVIRKRLRNLIRVKSHSQSHSHISPLFLNSLHSHFPLSLSSFSPFSFPQIFPLLLSLLSLISLLSHFPPVSPPCLTRLLHSPLSPLLPSPLFPLLPSTLLPSSLSPSLMFSSLTFSSLPPPSPFPHLPSGSRRLPPFSLLSYLFSSPSVHSYLRLFPFLLLSLTFPLSPLFPFPSTPLTSSPSPSVHSYLPLSPLSFLLSLTSAHCYLSSLLSYFPVPHLPSTLTFPSFSPLLPSSPSPSVHSYLPLSPLSYLPLSYLPSTLTSHSLPLSYLPFLPYLPLSPLSYLPSTLTPTLSPLSLTFRPLLPPTLSPLSYLPFTLTSLSLPFLIFPSSTFRPLLPSPPLRILTTCLPLASPPTQSISVDLPPPPHTPPISPTCSVLVLRPLLNLFPGSGSPLLTPFPSPTLSCCLSFSRFRIFFPLRFSLTFILSSSLSLLSFSPPCYFSFFIPSPFFFLSPLLHIFSSFPFFPYHFSPFPSSSLPPSLLPSLHISSSLISLSTLLLSISSLLSSLLPSHFPPPPSFSSNLSSPLPSIFRPLSFPSSPPFPPLRPRFVDPVSPFLLLPL